MNQYRSLTILFMFLLILNISNTNLFSATFYKCRSESGGITFSDTPCLKTDEVLHEKHVTRNKLSTVENNSAFEESDSEKSHNENTLGIMGDGTKQNKNQRLKIRISKILNSLKKVKHKILQYNNETGKWPENFSDIKMNQREMKSRYVTSLKIKENGKLIVFLNKSFGNKKILMLQPKEAISMGEKLIVWTCYTNFTKEVLRTIDEPMCISKKIFY